MRLSRSVKGHIRGCQGVSKGTCEGCKGHCTLCRGATENTASNPRCKTMNGSMTYLSQRGPCSIYCASLECGNVLLSIVDTASCLCKSPTTTLKANVKRSVEH